MTKSAAKATAFFPSYSSMRKYVDTFNKVSKAIGNPDAMDGIIKVLVKAATDAKDTKSMREALEHLVYTKAILECLAITEADIAEEVKRVLSSIKGVEYPETLNGNPLLYLSEINTAIDNGVSDYAEYSLQETFKSCVAEDPAETFRNVVEKYTYPVVKVKYTYERSSDMHFIIIDKAERNFSLEWLAIKARKEGGVGTSSEWADAVEALVMVHYRSNYEAIFERECKGINLGISPAAKAKADKIEKPSKNAITKLLNEVLLALGEVEGKDGKMKPFKALNHHAELLIRSSLTNVKSSKYAWASASIQEAYDGVFKILSNVLSNKIQLECRSEIKK